MDAELIQIIDDFGRKAAREYFKLKTERILNQTREFLAMAGKQKKKDRDGPARIVLDAKTFVGGHEAKIGAMESPVSDRVTIDCREPVTVDRNVAIRLANFLLDATVRKGER